MELKTKLRGKMCKDWSVVELKLALRKRKEKVSGTKLELCARLRDSYKTPVSSSVKTAHKKTTCKTPKGPENINTRGSNFKFYASLYYQGRKSSMARTHLESFGLNKTFLDTFDDHTQLADYINAYQNTL